VRRTFCITGKKRFLNNAPGLDDFFIKYTFSNRIASLQVGNMHGKGDFTDFLPEPVFF
jgi:hypothetical protein